MRTMEKSAKRTVASQLVDSVRDDIVLGRLLPGSRLNLRELGEQYSVGLIPLREALSRLSSSGFITAEDQRGFRVAEISRKELIDTQSLRAELECMALRQSIERGDVDWETQLIAAHHRMVRTQRTPEGGKLSLSLEWEANHLDYHMRLLGGCDNEWLLRFIRTLFEHSARYRQAMVLAKRPFHRDVKGEHQGLMDAALDRDADRACTLLRAHFDETTALVLAAMDEAEEGVAITSEGDRRKE